MTTPTTVPVRLQLRSDTAAAWAAVNPTLLAGELGLESDTYKIKVGNGSTAWNSLAYYSFVVSGGTVLGNLEIGSTGTLTFEGSTADGFETTLAVADPTTDRTITLPNQSGTVIVSGNASIVDADISASAEIAVSKLADGAARQLLQTDAAGTGVEWASNIDIPGTLDVTSAATFDSSVTVQGDLTVNGTTTTISTQNLLVEDKNIVMGDVVTPTDTTADGGGITLKGTTDKTINWIDATDAWTSSERFSYPLGSAAAPALTFTGDPNTGLYSPGADQVAISTNGTGRLFVNASGNVSIATNGTSSASEALCINGFAGFGDRALTNPFILLGNTGSGAGVFGTYSNHALEFRTNNTERMRLDSSGRLGLGTSSPQALLHLSSSTITESFYTATGTGGRTYRVGTGDNSAGLSGAFRIYDETGAAARLLIDSSGRVGIGTTSPGSNLDLTGTTSRIRWDVNNAYTLQTHANQNFSAFAPSIQNAADFQWQTAGTERARIDSSGRLLVGTSSAVATFNYAGADRTPRFQVVGDDINNGAAAIIRTGTAPSLFFGAGASGINVSGSSTLSRIVFSGFHTDKYYTGAEILALVDGTPGASDMPSALVFSTTADGASSPTERMRIGSNGAIRVGQTTTDAPGYQNTTQGISLEGNTGGGFFSRSGSFALHVNRITNDGDIVVIAQDGTQEGSISVNGTTVSYNGAHLSRWSQLPGNAERIEILRGTVLSNIDEMCGWGDEDNEQLNRMKVSDVEGDPNVSGVFQGWDDDDDTYADDFYCAMTGDFIIRIAEGVTVQRGDLLMSAGDGTAKPQDDDIVRSKTVAKVTSTYVTCTYDDGSYCVPCVLMAC